MSQNRWNDKSEYYLSMEWRKIRAFALNRAKYRCERCYRRYKLQVHHKTYDRLYNERLDDLEVLCPTCHKKADKERSRRDRYHNWRSSAMDTYATKKYGENWEHRGDVDYIAQEFDAWIEQKQSDEYDEGYY
jgi:hypothetical protein